MRAVVDRLQGLAPQPPGRVALGGRVRPGTGLERRGAAVPDAAQPLAGISGPEGDQFQTPDVTGESPPFPLLLLTANPAGDGFDSQLQAMSCDSSTPCLCMHCSACSSRLLGFAEGTERERERCFQAFAFDCVESRVTFLFLYTIFIGCFPVGPQIVL